MSPPLKPVLRVLSPGLGLTIQDRGRPGFGRFGVPRSGAMDPHAFTWANRLLDNSPNAPSLELLLQGALLEVLSDAWITVCGADLACSVPRWRTVRVKTGSHIEFSQNKSGIWAYLAIEGGFGNPAEHYFGSHSTYADAGLGKRFEPGDLLHGLGGPEPRLELPPSVASRLVPWDEHRDYRFPPPLRVWPGPQWELFSERDRSRFFENDWTTTSRSDRTGYRLSGPTLKSGVTQILSEAVLPGSIQIPGVGQPIVTMNDGPTVGGYPKLGLVEPADLSWLAQARPGTKVRFTLAH